MQCAKLPGHRDMLLKFCKKKHLHCWHNRPSSVMNDLLHQYINFIKKRKKTMKKKSLCRAQL